MLVGAADIPGVVAAGFVVDLLVCAETRTRARLSFAPLSPSLKRQYNTESRLHCVEHT